MYGMDRIARLCEEVHAFSGTVERTGAVVALRGLKAHNRTCTSLTDLVRKYKLYGDGLLYLPAGLWPAGQTEITLDNVKTHGSERGVAGEQAVRKRLTTSRLDCFPSSSAASSLAPPATPRQPSEDAPALARRRAAPCGRATSP
jgi:hypothetical protein